jgi:hypothetical protein
MSSIEIVEYEHDALDNNDLNRIRFICSMFECTLCDLKQRQEVLEKKQGSKWMAKVRPKSTVLQDNTLCCLKSTLFHDLPQFTEPIIVLISTYAMETPTLQFLMQPIPNFVPSITCKLTRSKFHSSQTLSFELNVFLATFNVKWINQEENINFSRLPESLKSLIASINVEKSQSSQLHSLERPLLFEAIMRMISRKQESKLIPLLKSERSVHVRTGREFKIRQAGEKFAELGALKSNFKGNRYELLKRQNYTKIADKSTHLHGIIEYGHPPNDSHEYHPICLVAAFGALSSHKENEEKQDEKEECKGCHDLDPNVGIANIASRKLPKPFYSENSNEIQRHEMLRIDNILPIWSDTEECFQLAFENQRMKEISVKNCILIKRGDPLKRTVLQFGRQSKEDRECFTLDFQEPITPFEAFSLGLSSVDLKLTV